MKIPFQILAFYLLLTWNPLSKLYAQEQLTLSYYLPETAYKPDIPSPSSYFGREVGSWHATHDQLLAYIKALDAASDRISLTEYGRSWENRPLVCLTITAPSNFSRLDEIKAARKSLLNPAESARLDLKNMPAVNYMGYSIHGNEASGSNAAMLVAYYLAAAQTPEVEQLLQNTVILLDPCFNPDGMQRFASWINTHKSQNLAPDASDNEYNEPWPRSRTNHYGFDLNRDWLVGQQPESVGRIRIFQEWHPNVLTDHHEMGSGSTFFFQPGVPSRVNPITPFRNQELTAKIAGYHASLFSEKKILFYTGENFDDFYYGKGSTYPDAQGSIGILFEQASSRGSAQETENGLLTFPYSIRNQVLASLSTLKAVAEMRQELNEYLRDFYKTGLEEARNSPVEGYVFEGDDIPGKAFLQLLDRHGIKVQTLDVPLFAGTESFPKGSFFVPATQTQYRLIRGIFERQTQFQDSIFYDISAWTLPDAFGLHWSGVNSKRLEVSLKSMPEPSNTQKAQPGKNYALVYRSPGYDMPKQLYSLQKAGYRVHVALKSFDAEGTHFDAGSLVIPADRQKLSTDLLIGAEKKQQDFPDPFVLTNGLSSGGPDLGSSNFPVIRLPKIVLLTGEGVNVGDAGEIWHLLDTRYNIPITQVDKDRFGALNLDNYNVLLLADGTYGNLSVEKVRQFVQDGGTVVATGSTLKWLKNSGLVPLEFRNQAPDLPGRRPYDKLAEDRGARSMPGAIFEAELDLSHPLCFGYTRAKLPLFISDTLFVETGKNPYSTPVVLSKNPLLAGYVHAKQKPLIPNAAGAIVCGIGRGKIICFPGNPNFRGFWYGTNRLFANAIFFGNLINSDGVEKK